jgi:hypothetical protein
MLPKFFNQAGYPGSFFAAGVYLSEGHLPSFPASLGLRESSLVRGLQRVLNVMTDTNGQFSTVFCCQCFRFRNQKSDFDWFRVV